MFGNLMKVERASRHARASENFRRTRDAHNYLSTACLHERHDQCRQTCKFCTAPCRCKCHG